MRNDAATKAISNNTELPYLGKNPASDKLDLFMPWTAAIRKNCILPTKKISPEDL